MTGRETLIEIVRCPIYGKVETAKGLLSAIAILFMYGSRDKMMKKICVFLGYVYWAEFGRHEINIHAAQFIGSLDRTYPGFFSQKCARSHIWRLVKNGPETFPSPNKRVVTARRAFPKRIGATGARWYTKNHTR